MGLAWLTLLDHHETLAVQLHCIICDQSSVKLSDTSRCINTDGKMHGEAHQYGAPIFTVQGCKAMLASDNCHSETMPWISVQVCATPSYCMQLSALLQEQRMTPLGKLESALNRLFSEQKVDKKHRQHNSHRHGSPWTWTHKPLIMVSSGEPW